MKNWVWCFVQICVPHTTDTVRTPSSTNTRNDKWGSPRRSEVANNMLSEVKSLSPIAKQRRVKSWAGTPETQNGFGPAAESVQRGAARAAAQLAAPTQKAWKPQGSQILEQWRQFKAGPCRTSTRASRYWTQQAILSGRGCVGERGRRLTVLQRDYCAALGYCMCYSWESYDAVTIPCCLMQLQIPYILH